MSTAVTPYDSASLTERQQYASTLAAAGDLIPKGLWNQATNVNGQMVPAAPSPGKVLLVMETGAMLGLMPAAALQSIDVVEGRATLSARLMGALIRKAGHKLEVAKSGSIPTGDYKVTVTGTRSDDGSVFTSVWDIPRAVRAQLVQSYKPNAQGVWEVRARNKNGDVAKPWEAYAELMPVWRAISEVGREGFADVLFGLYSTEEITDGGSIPVADPEPEPSKDWKAEFENAATVGDLESVGEALKSEPDQIRLKMRAPYLARLGVLKREAEIVDAEVVTDDDETPSGGEDASPSAPSPSPSEGLTEEDYEAAASAEFDAAVDAGEVQS
ncbi:hypothetical protein PTQ19_10130 [Microbacterium esteraromaticum]|uniref:hypothetical protein n=1 Tax=Microbacterium esteraromaticum TaxID=57043 RepID=UPI002367561C|nr:hypothetical protein [Microbacterium esteraromaticum]WDH77878.1 hypothetical protein PTQ19_10130 [Microbacterium esteraromaticum]